MLLNLKSLLFIFFGVLLLIFYENYDKLNVFLFENDLAYATLAVGILSARENFAQRNVIRSTWLAQTSFDEYSIKPWFILGKESCLIPPEYRLSVYGCEKWNINISNVKKNFYTSYMKAENESHNLEFNSDFYQGFSFQVNYPVVVTKLGVPSCFLLPNDEIKVSLMNLETKEVFAEASLSSNQSVGAYCYANVNAVLLPKGYEALILVDGYLHSNSCSYALWNDGGGLITFKKVFKSDSHLDSIMHKREFFAAPSIEFYVPDVEGLRKIAEEEDDITKNWHLGMDNVNNQIEDENSKYEDIIIVNIIDTYHNLPMKLLKFYSWLVANEKFQFVMKTDDDCIVDTHYIIEKLRKISRFHASKFWMLSKFRKGWPVHYIGKWAENDYKSPYYPIFPCGAAYILPHSVVEWLSINAEMLFPYQGEDVSIGIWLAALNPEFIEDENFECGSECDSRSINRAQLNVSEILDAWMSYKICKSLCSCK